MVHAPLVAVQRPFIVFRFDSGRGVIRSNSAVTRCCSTRDPPPKPHHVSLGGNYGGDVAITPSFAERNNLAYQGCIDRYP